MIRRLKSLGLIDYKLAQTFYSVKITSVANQYGFQSDIVLLIDKHDYFQIIEV